MTQRNLSVDGKFGVFGGRYIPEILMNAVMELEEEYLRTREDSSFQEELNRLLRDYAGRPTPLYHCGNLSRRLGGARIYLKREDLLHGGAHKINNTLGQALLARRMGKRRIIAETGAGQHGVATAMACAALGLKAEVYMGTEDMERQKLNVFRMKLLGAMVHPVDSGSRTLKDAINDSLRDWAANAQDTYYLIGSVVGPHPYPMIVRDFQSVIGREARQQSMEAEGRLPDQVVACVGGGSNAMGIFHAFLEDPVGLVGVEAGGEGLETGRHAASLGAGEEGVLHGMLTYLLQDEHGQIRTTHSVSAGLDYPGVGPELSYLFKNGRLRVASATDGEALAAVTALSRDEGIVPALEPAHAIAEASKMARGMSRDGFILVNLSGRGDKDVETVARNLGEEI